MSKKLRFLRRMLYGLIAIILLLFFKVVTSGPIEQIEQHHKSEPGFLGSSLSAEAAVAIFTLLLVVATIALVVATRDLVKGADKNARRQLRAYVHVKDATVTRDGLQAFYNLHIHNYGQTPAHKIEIIYETELRKYDETSKFIVGGAVNYWGSLAPTQDSVINFSEESKFTIDQWNHIDDKTIRLYVFGEVKYTDSFGKKRVTKFRAMTYKENSTDNPRRLGLCSEGNDAK